MPVWRRGLGSVFFRPRRQPFFLLPVFFHAPVSPASGLPFPVAMASSSRLWPASPLPPSASIATGPSIPIRVIAAGSPSARSLIADRPASGTARPSGSANPPTPTPSRALPTPIAPATRLLEAFRASPTTPARRPLATQIDLKTLSINHLTQNPTPLRYKIPAPHRYKIHPFPIPLSSWGLSLSTSALRYQRTSAPSSISWHGTAWPSSGMEPAAGLLFHE